MGKWTRRALITAGGLVGGGLLVGVGGIAFAPNRLNIRPDDNDGGASLTTWVKITPDNKVIAVIPHCEMGQGAQTGLAMMLAEELEAAWDDVVIEEAPPVSVYANGHLIAGFVQVTQSVPSWLTRVLEYAAYQVSKVVPLQITGGSSSTITTGRFGMRVAGAAAKGMLLEAAAAEWGVPVEECIAVDTHVEHRRSGQRTSFGALASRAAELTPPRHPQLKTPDQFKLIGTSHPRRDLPEKVTGQATYAVDIALPDMLYATIAASPIPGGTLQSVDTQPALDIDGVNTVVELADAVAVVASGYPAALKGLRALKPTFGEGVGKLSTAELWAQHAAILDTTEGEIDHEVGQGAGGLASASRVVEAEYRAPYLAHATMEPMAATARISDGVCEVWAGTQDPLNARRVAAKAAEMDDDQVVFHNTHSGGGFGRRLPGAFDYIDQAVRIAKAMSPVPVKLIWSREEDMQHDFYRPALLGRFSAGLNERNEIDTWVSRFTGPAGFGEARTPYDAPNQAIVAYEPPEHLRVGSWRSVGHSQQGFFVESFVDELAAAAGKDPYRFRRDSLAHNPRYQSVLDRAAAMANWDQSPPAGRGRGIAIVEAFGTVVAQVVEISIEAGQRIKVHDVWAAVDCGSLVNPDQGLAQIQGGILFGLSAALYQEITVKNGAVVQQNFPSYPSLTLADTPRVEVDFVPSDHQMGGLGEPGVPPIAAAVANAVYALTHRRLRTLPLRIA